VRLAPDVLYEDAAGWQAGVILFLFIAPQCFASRPAERAV